MATELSKEPIRLLLISRQPLLRDSFTLLFNRQRKLTVIGACETLAEATSAVLREAPDVILFDLYDVEERELNYLSELRAALPDIHTLAIGDSADSPLAQIAVSRGASGVIARTAPTGVVISAIKRAHANEPWLDHETIRETARRRLRAVENIVKLTDRERELIQMLAQGFSITQTAFCMGISILTVRNYMRSIYDKLGLKNQNELIVYAFHNGLPQSFVTAEPISTVPNGEHSRC